MSDHLGNRPGGVGWHQDPADPTTARYWNGTAWTAVRRWNGTDWVDQAAPFAIPSVPVPNKRSGPNRTLLVGGLVAVGVVIALFVFGVVLDDNGSGSDTDESTFRTALMAECGTDPEFPADACECVVDRMLDEFSTDELIEMGLDNPEGDLSLMSAEDRTRLLDAAMPCASEGS
jgi:hypothetical protein